jgi:excisionase family DNA binding protein
MTQQTGVPTLAEIESWPLTVSVPDAARVLGIGRSTAYELVLTGELPVKAVRVGGRWRVLTASLIEFVTPNGERAAS